MPRYPLITLTLVTAALASGPPAANAALDRTMELLSVGPSGGNAEKDSIAQRASADGSAGAFVTDEALVPEDTDALVDVYSPPAV